MPIAHLFDLVQYGSSNRFNCPECGGKNTLDISKIYGSIVYNCHNAKCNIKGSRLLRMTEGDLSLKVASHSPLEARTAVKREFRLPDYWIEGIASKKAFQMLFKGNAIEAYTSGMFKVALDPRQDRCVFLLEEKGKIVGGIGRALSGQKPKVLNYPDSKSIPFICGKGDTVVLVEDCLSACSIARIKGYAGLALLGTELKDSYLHYILSTYENIVIALDPDAYAKSFKLQGKMKYYTENVKIWRLNNELKDMTKSQIQEFTSL